MKKLFLILFLVTTSLYSMNAMEQSQNIPLYEQSDNLSIADIKNIITQIEQSQIQYSNLFEMQTQNKISYNHNIEKASDWCQFVNNQEYDIKYDDTLINDEKLLNFIHFNRSLPYFVVLTLAQEYLLNSHTMTKSHKYAIMEKVQPVLTTPNLLLWPQPYTIENLDTLQQVLEHAYPILWNFHKSRVVATLQQFYVQAQLQSQACANLLSITHAEQIRLSNDYAYYLQALLHKNNAPTPTKSDVASVVHVTEQAIELQNNEMASQENNSTSQEIQSLEKITKIKQKKVPFQTIKEKNLPQILSTEQQSDFVVAENQQVIKNIQVALQAQSAETTQICEQKVVMNAPKKIISLSKKQLTALAVEKKAEQSRIDKERNRLALEQKDAEEASKKLTVIAPALTVVTKNSSSKTSQKKSTNKKPVQPTVDEDDAILDAIIAENKKELTHKKLSDVANKKPYDLDQINQTITQIDKSPTQQGNSRSVIVLKITDTTDYRLSSQYIQEYQQFIEQRDRVLQEIGAAKEIVRKENLKKILHAKPHERQALKDQLEKKLATQFNPMSQTEYEVLIIFKSYAAIVAHKDMQAEHFVSTYNGILAKEQELAEKNIQLRWYLASHPEIYNHIKSHVIQLKKRLYASEKLRLAEQDDMQNRDESDKDNDETTILDIVNRLHTNDGILDISNILYQYKTKEEIYPLGRLTQEDLHSTSNIIKSIYASHNNLDTLDFNKTQNALLSLFIVAGIGPTHHYMIDSIINLAADNAGHTKSEKDAAPYLNNLDSIVFNNMQCKNEMILEFLTEGQIADITKINNMVHTVFIEIANSKQRDIENNK